MRPYARLRGLMVANGDTRRDVANALLIGVTNVSLKMNAKVPWSSEEMWTLMERYDVDPKDMAAVFPRRGENGCS